MSESVRIGPFKSEIDASIFQGSLAIEQIKSEVLNLESRVHPETTIYGGIFLLVAKEQAERANELHLATYGQIQPTVVGSKNILIYLGTLSILGFFVACIGSGLFQWEFPMEYTLGLAVVGILLLMIGGLGR